MRELSKGIDYTVKDIAEAVARGRKFKYQTLVWYEYKLNFCVEAMGWGYAYIHPDEFQKVRKMGIKGGVDPQYFGSAIVAGQNLVKFSKEFWKNERKKNEQRNSIVGKSS